MENLFCAKCPRLYSGEAATAALGKVQNKKVKQAAVVFFLFFHKLKTLRVTPHKHTFHDADHNKDRHISEEIDILLS